MSPKYSGKCFLSVKKKSCPQSNQHMEVISKREVKKKKKKSRNSTFQKYHSHAGRKSCTLFLIVNLCRLKEPRGPIPVVGGWGWVQFSSPASCKVARPGRRGIRRVCPLSHQVQHDLSRMPSFVDYLHPRKATAMGCISSTQPWHGEESSPHPHSPNPGA